MGHIPINRTLTTDEEIKGVKSAIKNRTGTLKDLAKSLNLPEHLIKDLNSGRVYKDI